MTEDAIEGALDPHAVDEESLESARERAARAHRIVVKAGTNSLTDAESNLDRAKLDRLVDGLVALLEDGREVLLVSSGAIGAGKGEIEQDGETVEEAQALSTIGQSNLMHAYTESFGRYGKTVSQLLLTDQDMAEPDRFTNFKNTVETLLSWGVVPIINENDAVATEEIRIGDNDMLSASVAIGVEADLLVTLTDVDGVYTDNPKANADAEYIEGVGRNYAAVQEAIGEESASFGGIQTKVAGAREVTEHGTPVIIAHSAREGVLEEIVAGKAVGTVFIPMNGDDDE
jgi:glutamate 5-kinase